MSSDEKIKNGIYIVVEHDRKYYRVLLDKKTGLVNDPDCMYSVHNQITKKEAMKFYGKYEQ
jgi:hypothetical protein